MGESVEFSSRLLELRGDRMRTPDEVAAIIGLRDLGWGIRRIAREVGCSHVTVRRYVAARGWTGYRRPRRAKALEGLDEWLAERFRQHRGNADVVRQDLAREKGISVSLRTVERAVAERRRALRAQARATVRFETPPGQQLQIDFGQTHASVGGQSVRVCLFVATLGYSRRVFVQAFRHERQPAWFDGIEGAFAHFGGVAREVLLDNARALVDHHDAATREVRFNERLQAFARYWGFTPRACAPYRAGAKGKDERGVGYVKSNAIAGHAFISWAALEAHLVWWMREIADRRVHGTTEEPPLARFQRDEAAALRSLEGRPPFRQMRELVRQVRADCAIELDTNAYSVPWRLVGETVRVVVAGGRVSVRHRDDEVANHAETAGRRQRVSDLTHFTGIAATKPSAPPAAIAGEPPAPSLGECELARPLSEYERLIGGGWR